MFWIRKCCLDVEVPAYIWVISLVGRREEGRGGGVGGVGGGRGG